MICKDTHFFPIVQIFFFNKYKNFSPFTRPIHYVPSALGSRLPTFPDVDGWTVIHWFRYSVSAKSKFIYWVMMR